MAITSAQFTNTGSAGPWGLANGAANLADAVRVSGGTGSATAEDSVQGAAFLTGFSPLSTPPTETAEIVGLTIRATVRTIGAGEKLINMGVRPPGTSTNFTHETLQMVESETYDDLEWTWTTNPNTNAPWTTAEVTGISRLYIYMPSPGTAGLELDTVEALIEWEPGEPGQEYNVPIANTLLMADPIQANLTPTSSEDMAIITDTFNVQDMISAMFADIPTSVGTFPLVSIGSAGSWTATPGSSNLPAAVGTPGDDIYAESGPTHSNMFGGINNPSLTGTISWVRINVVARLGEPGDGRGLSSGIRVGAATVQWHDTVDVASTSWGTFVWEYPTNPHTNTPWTPTDVENIQRVYVRANGGSGNYTTNLHVDYVYLTIGYNEDAEGPSSQVNLIETLAIDDMQQPEQVVIEDDEPVDPSNLNAFINENLRLSDSLVVTGDIPTPPIETGTFMLRGHAIMAIYLGSNLIWAATN